MDVEAESSLAAMSGVSFIPQMMGERTPDWNASRFGAFFGLVGTPTRGELYRAILESAGFDLLRLDEADVIEPDEKTHERYLEFFERV